MANLFQLSCDALPPNAAVLGFRGDEAMSRPFKFEVAVWVPLGEFDTGLGFENHTSHPSRGDILLYPGGLSETEILFAYGSSCFASKMGQLAGNHFLSVVEGAEQLHEMGRTVLWKGAQWIRFTDLGER